MQTNSQMNIVSKPLWYSEIVITGVVRVEWGWIGNLGALNDLIIE
jgi:hypothetical protein